MKDIDLRDLDGVCGRSRAPGISPPCGAGATRLGLEPDQRLRELEEGSGSPDEPHTRASDSPNRELLLAGVGPAISDVVPGLIRSPALRGVPSGRLRSMRRLRRSI